MSIILTDDNDNAPVFPVASFDVKLSEYAKLNAEVPLVSATDLDSPPFSVANYRIAGGNVNNAFRLSTRQLNNVLYLDLIVNGELDREFRDSYQLVVEAIDGGNPPKVGSLLVNVTVVDANDNAPEFEKSRYSAKMPRNATVGSPVLTVAAHDRDAGPNAQIVYKILPTPTDSHKIFKIDSRTGLITVGEPLIGYAQNSFELIVVATDSGIQPLESTAFVSIAIADSRRSDSDIQVLFLTPDGQPSLSENALIGDLVARVSINDADSSNSNGSLSMTGDFGHFTLQRTGRSVHVLRVRKSLDRESVDSYSIELTWKDGDGSTAKKRVVIDVGDVNDNHPRFTRNTYEAQVIWNDLVNNLCSMI